MLDLGYDEKEAEQLYFDVQTLGKGKDANSWIAPWPSFQSQLTSCSSQNTSLICGSVIVNLSSMEAYVNTNQGLSKIHSVVYPTNDSLFESVANDSKTDLTLALVPSASGFSGILMTKELGMSMFTKLFFFNGHGSKYFAEFSQTRDVKGIDIKVWKVDWTGSSVRNLNDLPLEEPTIENNGSITEVKARHILISTDNHDEAEALKMIKDIAKNATAENFADLAKAHSEGPSSVNGGDLGWFGKGKMVKPFEDAAFSTEVGKISEPVKTDFGYHLILVEDQR